MELGLLILVGIFGAGGILAGAFIAVNVVSAVLTSADRPLTQTLDSIGTHEFDQPRANTASKRFTEKPKPDVSAGHAAAKDKSAETAKEGHVAAKTDGHAAPAAAAGGDGQKNDRTLAKIAKVWIAPGCIVCDACVQTCPEVFKIEGDTCIIVPSPNLSLTDSIKDAADGCPVDVIKYA